MISVTRFNGTTFFINPELICTLEQTPDTVITLTNGEKFVVTESAELVAERFVAYKQRCVSGQSIAVP